MIGPDFSLRPGPAAEYYLNFRVPTMYKDLDDLGIPMIPAAGGPPRYNWTVVQQEAIRRFQYWVDDGSEERKSEFLSVAEFCYDGLEHLNSRGVGWYFRRAVKRHNIGAEPRISGMSQGQGISVLTRAFALSGEERFASKANESFDLLVANAEVGGARYATPEGNWWFEERLKPDPPFTLNGFIYALFGIADLSKVTGESKHRQALEKGVAALKELLSAYDRFGWSLYELKPVPYVANTSYHLCHSNQLKAMGYIAGEEEFLSVSFKWEGQHSSRYSRSIHVVLAQLNGLVLRHHQEGFVGTIKLTLLIARGAVRQALHSIGAKVRAVFRTA